MIDRDKVNQELIDLRESIPQLVQHVILTAKVTRAKYDALVKEGFTEAQAIELCRTGTLL